LVLFLLFRQKGELIALAAKQNGEWVPWLVMVNKMTEGVPSGIVLPDYQLNQIRHIFGL
jgi:hypothetical protein